MTHQRIIDLGNSLGVAPQSINQFVEEVNESGHTAYSQLAIDSFAFISDWYHFAIIELLKLKKCKHDPRWMASTLNISLTELNLAIDCLIRLNLIKKKKKGGFDVIRPNSSVIGKENYTNNAMKEYQKKLLKMAIEAIDEIPLGDRDNSAFVFSMPKGKMPELIEEVKIFRRNLVDNFEDYEHGDQVYHMAISIYPLLKKEV